MNEALLKRYTDFFEQLTPGRLNDFSTVMTEDVHFTDPFNDVTGLEAIRKIFRHMFDNLEEPRFKVKRAALAEGDPSRALLSWEMSATLNGKPYGIVGMSDIAFAEDGRVREHIDHWDASTQFYSRIPVIGWLLGLIQARLRV